MSIKKCVNFTGQHTVISKKGKSIIFCTRKYPVFNDQHVWIKKEGVILDVTIAAFDVAYVFEVVGNILLDQLPEIYNKKDIGLYRDLAIWWISNI